MLGIIKRRWANLLFVLSLAGVCLWYLLDTMALSMSATNLILILPATLLCIFLCLLILREEIVEGCQEVADDEPSEEPQLDQRIPALMGLVGLFVWGAMSGGFDLATFAFCAASLALLGERRWWVLILYPAVFTFCVVGTLRLTLSYETPGVLF